MVGKSRSVCRSVHLGVPQGSVLGPLLFILYINDMFNSCPGLQLIHFADDTSAFLSNSSSDRLCRVVNRELGNLNEWLNANRLSLNVSKSQFMVFSDSRISVDFSLSINSIPLTSTSNAKFLGIHIDDKLNFKLHVNNVITKISRVRGMLWRCGSLVSLAVKKMVYQSLVFSHLSYGVIVWGKSSVGNELKIKATQNRIIRQIYGSAGSEIYSNYKILSFENLYEYFILIKLFMEFNKGDVSYFSSKVLALQTNHRYSTRFNESECLIPPSLVKSKCMKSFLYQSIASWNALPLYIKHANSSLIFKRQVKEYLFSRHNE